MPKALTMSVMIFAAGAVINPFNVKKVVASATYAKLPLYLEAKDVLPENLLRGKNYRVEAKIRNDGLVNTYQLRTSYGPATVESTAALMIRIDELNALAMMEEIEQTAVFGEAVVKGAKAPVQGVVDLVKEPVETTKGAFTGAGRFLSNIGRAIVSDDPHQDNALKVALGYDAAKRSFAYEFGINPYSNYTPVTERLGEIARSAVAGGLAPKAVMASIDHGVVTAMQITGTTRNLSKLVRDNPPGELHKVNKKKLKSLGVPTALAEAFLSNYAYNPQEETFLVGALEELNGASERMAFIAAAETASERSTALFYRVMAEMMAGYHTSVAPAQGIATVGKIPYIKNKDGAAVFLFPLDYVFRTEDVEGKLNRLDGNIRQVSGMTAKEMWITGMIEPAARAMFETRGWKVEENVRERLLRN